MPISDDLDDGVRDLRAVQLGDNDIRTWVIQEVISYNKDHPNPHPITIGQLNRYLTDRNLLPTMNGSEDEVVGED